MIKSEGYMLRPITTRPTGIIGAMSILTVAPTITMATMPMVWRPIRMAF